MYPVTVTGRCVAAALMLGGIALLGVVTATIASWLVEKVAEAPDSGHSPGASMGSTRLTSHFTAWPDKPEQPGRRELDEMVAMANSRPLSARSCA